MGRRIRTTIPLVMKQLVSNWSYLSEFKKDNWKFKEKQKEDFDHRHGAKEQLLIYIVHATIYSGHFHVYAFAY